MARRLVPLFALVLVLSAFIASPGSASTPGTDVRLTNDDPSLSGYVSTYTLATGQPYTDDVLQECSRARGRQNEPAVEIDPRNNQVIIGSSNDYCGVFTDSLAATLGPVWLGYYRSEDGGQSFVSSLVPGYPKDQSPFAQLAHVRTFDAGDPVIAWDAEGRVFMGSESSGDPEQPNKTNGDVWVARFVNPDGPTGDTSRDGLLYRGSETVATGSASFSGNFNDKTAIEADRTNTRCRGNVYFSWSRFNGGGSSGYNSAVYFSRSTNHGARWSNPMRLSNTVHDIQSPDISITGNGDVYVTFREFADVRSNTATDSLWYVKSTNCGQTFSAARKIVDFIPYDPADYPDPEAIPQPTGPREPGEEEGTGGSHGSSTVVAPANDCGDFDSHCRAGYTFFRISTQVRATADQNDTAHQYVYIVFDPTKPGTQTPSGTTFGTVTSVDLPLKYHKNVGSQAGVFFIRLNGTNGSHTSPALIDNQSYGHQIFPDIAANNGVLHTIWWDSRNDECYSPTRPIGNCADRSTVPSLDTFGSQSTNFGATWAAGQRISDVTHNPNYEQFAGRTVPFAGDYLWVSSQGGLTFGVWTDQRDTVQGEDPREAAAGDEDGFTADVLQCRTF
ncbi:MAG TPA: sialidase family protein, partial [Actinomycetota bacterium]